MFWKKFNLILPLIVGLSFLNAESQLPASPLNQKNMKSFLENEVSGRDNKSFYVTILEHNTDDYDFYLLKILDKDKKEIFLSKNFKQDPFQLLEESWRDIQKQSKNDLTEKSKDDLCFEIAKKLLSQEVGKTEVEKKHALQQKILSRGSDSHAITGSGFYPCESSAYKRLQLKFPTHYQVFKL